MDFTEANQVLPEHLGDIYFDLIIGVSGRENRSDYLLRKYSPKGEKKLAISCSKTYINLIRSKKNNFLSEQGYELIDTNINNSKPITEKICSILEQKPHEEINILVDYTSMASCWYAGIIQLMDEIEDFENVVNIYFSYTPGVYSKTGKARSVKLCESMLLGKGLLNSKKETRIIVGLGLQAGYTEFLMKEVHADSYTLLYSDPAPDGYVKNIFDTHKKIINKVDIRNFHNYPLNDINKTTEILTNICVESRIKYNVVIVPVGPKVFTLASLLISIRYPDVDVWRLCTGNYQPITGKNAASEPIIDKVRFENLEE